MVWLRKCRREIVTQPSHPPCENIINRKDVEKGKAPSRRKQKHVRKLSTYLDCGISIYIGFIILRDCVDKYSDIVCTYVDRQKD